MIFASEIDPRSRRDYRLRKVGFYGVEQVREVERLLLNTLALGDGSTSGREIV